MTTPHSWFYWAIFAFTFLGERPAAREWIGIAMVAGGVLLLAIKR